jgi:hypothetical protein
LQAPADKKLCLGRADSDRLAFQNLLGRLRERPECRERVNVMTKAAGGMTAKQLEACCGRWPGVTRDIKWGGDLVFSVGGKMFVVTPLDGAEGGRLSFKVEDERFLELTDQPGIIPAP